MPAIARNLPCYLRKRSLNRAGQIPEFALSTGAVDSQFLSEYLAEVLAIPKKSSRVFSGLREGDRFEWTASAANHRLKLGAFLLARV
jgi:hypothetical protein